MRMREFVTWGVIAGMVLTSLTLTSVTRGPGPDSPGEATTSVLGVVIDRVHIPADPHGNVAWPRDQIQQGWLLGLAVAAVGGAVLGAGIGWTVERSRRLPSPA